MHHPGPGGKDECMLAGLDARLAFTDDLIALSARALLKMRAVCSSPRFQVWVSSVVPPLDFTLQANHALESVALLVQALHCCHMDPRCPGPSPRSDRLARAGRPCTPSRSFPRVDACTTAGAGRAPPPCKSSVAAQHSVMRLASLLACCRLAVHSPRSQRTLLSEHVLAAWLAAWLHPPGPACPWRTRELRRARRLSSSKQLGRPCCIACTYNHLPASAFWGA